MIDKKIKIFRNEKGITLVALVTTIIVLLILARVTISIISGDRGLLNKANEAEAMTALRDGKEYIRLEIVKIVSNSKNGNISNEISKALESTIDGIKSVNDKLTVETPFNDSKNKIKLTYKEKWSVVGIVNVNRRHKMDR